MIPQPKKYMRNTGILYDDWRRYACSLWWRALFAEYQANYPESWEDHEAAWHVAHLQRFGKNHIGAGR